MGTATLEEKLAQQLAFLQQEMIYEVFVDLKKAYDAMDRNQYLEILRGYGVGPLMLRLIKFFWDHTDLVCQANDYFSEPFRAYQELPKVAHSRRVFSMQWSIQLFGNGSRRCWAMKPPTQGTSS